MALVLGFSFARPSDAAATPPRSARRAVPMAVLLVTLLACALAASPAHALRVVTWNLLQYPDYNLAGRQPSFRTVMANINADVLIAQELLGQAGVDSFQTNVLNVVEPGQWAAAPWVNGNDTDNALFYKPAKVQFLGGWAWTPPEPAPLRLVNCYRLKLVGYSDASTELRI